MYFYHNLTPEQKAEILQYRKQQGLPPHSPPHPIQDQQFYLLTAACYQHQPRINTLSRRQELLDQLFTHFLEVGSEIRSERHYYATLNYIHYNPVKHNYVKSPYDWETSSIHWYLQEKGRDWLRSCWVEYPVRDYGKGWDDCSS